MLVHRWFGHIATGHISHAQTHTQNFPFRTKTAQHTIEIIFAKHNLRFTLCLLSLRSPILQFQLICLFVVQLKIELKLPFLPGDIHYLILFVCSLINNNVGRICGWRTCLSHSRQENVPRTRFTLTGFRTYLRCHREFKQFSNSLCRRANLYYRSAPYDNDKYKYIS